MVLLFNQNVKASIDFIFEPQIQKMWGSTLYHISIPITAQDSAGNVYPATEESQLEFPLDTWMLGFNGKVSKDISENVTLFLQGNFSFNINNPSGVMTDTDWYTVMSYQQTFSYTESESQLNVKSFDINAGLDFFKYSFINKILMTLSAKLGYKQQKLSYDIIGIKDGWQNIDSYVQFNNLYQGVEVLSYEVTYRIPYISILGEIKLNERIKLNGEVGFSPIVSAQDNDDHILRYKTATGDCTGTAFMAAGNFVWFLSPTFSETFLNIGINYLSISTTGSQSQSWYGNDPASSTPTTGMTVNNISDTISSEQFSLTASIGVKI